MTFFGTFALYAYVCKNKFQYYKNYIHTLSACRQIIISKHDVISIVHYTMQA